MYSWDKADTRTYIDPSHCWSLPQISRGREQMPRADEGLLQGWGCSGLFPPWWCWGIGQYFPTSKPLFWWVCPAKPKQHNPRDRVQSSRTAWITVSPKWQPGAESSLGTWWAQSKPRDGFGVAWGHHWASLGRSCPPSLRCFFLLCFKWWRGWGLSPARDGTAEPLPSPWGHLCSWSLHPAVLGELPWTFVPFASLGWWSPQQWDKL